MPGIRASAVTAFLAVSPFSVSGMVELGQQPGDGISAVEVRGGCGDLQSQASTETSGGA